MLIQFSSTALNLIPPVIPPMSFHNKRGDVCFGLGSNSESHLAPSFHVFSSRTVLWPCTLGHCQFWGLQITYFVERPQSSLPDASSPSDVDHAILAATAQQGVCDLFKGRQHLEAQCVPLCCFLSSILLLAVVFRSSFGHAPGSFLSSFWLFPFYPRHFFAPSLFYFLRMNSGTWGKSWRKKWRR